MNQCGSCSHDFASVSLFDAHRTGKHEHLFSESHPDGRRCLSVDEMTSKGWTLNSRGRWSDQARNEVVRAAFRDAA
jgi:hypothetical protein